MDMLKRLNDVMQYIEQNLCFTIDFHHIAKLACTTPDSFHRFFSYMTGMTITEYIRRRRLTLAAYDLQQSNARIIDIAVKYGYESADAFSRAFSKQHGITPTQARKRHGSLKVYPPASFYITVQGAKKMDFKIIDVGEIAVYGRSKAWDERKYSSREELRHCMWDENTDSVPGKICAGKWNQMGNSAYDGVWYGIWHDGRYLIGREKELVQKESLEKHTIAQGQYAAFQTEPGGLAWEEIPKLTELIFNSWLPSSGYVCRNNDMIEIYHLWTDPALRRKNRYYEIWIPIASK